MQSNLSRWGLFLIKKIAALIKNKVNMNFFYISAIILILSSNAEASLLNINPIHLAITNDEPVAILEVKNLSNNKVVMQADVLGWLQKEQAIVTSPTEEVVISPPLFRLGAGQTQLLRVAWIKNHPLALQQTYRVILREIATNSLIVENRNQDRLHIALLISIPLFIHPVNQQPLFQWKFEWIDKKTLKLIFNNKGNVTFRINQINFLINNKVFLRQQTFAYVLPKHDYSWLFKIGKSDFNVIAALVNGEWKAQRV
jgi:fimbrial chaperone protein